jgi:hexosaminidase
VAAVPPAATGAAAAPAAPAPAAAVPAPPHAVIPAPAAAAIAPADSFRLDSTTQVVLDAAAPAEVEAVARLVAAMVPRTAALPFQPRPADPAPRRLAAGEAPPRGSIHLALDPRVGTGADGVRKEGAGDFSAADEAYALAVTRDGVRLTARRPAGLFYGVQTLRQLLPAAVEHPAALGRRMAAPAGRVTDQPRFGWRGVMLDVSRHFLPAADVKRFVDLMALYKLNRLHLHLSDDQGWRIEIRSRPELARVGGSTQVGGGPGGHYTQAEYADIVAYAAARYVMVVPELDMPAHTNAALASIPALNCDRRAPALYTGTKVGFSALCADSAETYRFVDDVVREVAALTPGPFVHIGGDEVEKLTHPQYVAFIERVQGIVRRHGKRMIGGARWRPPALDPSSVVQHWRRDSSAMHAARGGSLILSPSSKVYLDMKYDAATPLGLRWAGLVDVRTAYDWEPATYLAGVPERAVLGVEAPLWSETVVTRGDFEFMAFPRLAAVAELGWSSPAVRGWEGFRARLGAHGPRLSALGVNFYRAPEIPWETGAARPAPAVVP